MHLGGELLTIGGLFLIAYVLGRLGKTIGLPAIPVYMVVGLIASPHTPWIGLSVESHTIELIATFGRKQDNPAIVLSYAALEGLFLCAASFLFANLVSSGGPGMIAQAIVATFGVFFGMLVVYKTGAIRVTPKLTRMIIAGLFGVMALMLLNVVLALFGVGGGEGFGLRSGGPIAIGFSLLCIALAAFSFLIDFDAADQMVRAGVPSKAGWGIALGLTVTLVWLYLEILRLLSYFNND
jgi:uncharacterized YccA/Bax inhibitor family protein